MKNNIILMLLGISFLSFSTVSCATVSEFEKIKEEHAQKLVRINTAQEIRAIEIDALKKTSGILKEYRFSYFVPLFLNVGIVSFISELFQEKEQNGISYEDIQLYAAIEILQKNRGPECVELRYVLVSQTKWVHEKEPIEGWRKYAIGKIALSNLISEDEAEKLPEDYKEGVICIDTKNEERYFYYGRVKHISPTPFGIGTSLVKLSKKTPKMLSFNELLFSEFQK